MGLANPVTMELLLIFAEPAATREGALTKKVTLPLERMLRLVKVLLFRFCESVEVPVLFT